MPLDHAKIDSLAARVDSVNSRLDAFEKRRRDCDKTDMTASGGGGGGGVSATVRGQMSHNQQTNKTR